VKRFAAPFAAVTLFATRASAIVDGTVDTTRPDVLLLQDDTLAGFRCTATLIAPNLVITARHCVGKRSTGTTLCKGGATDEGAQSLPNYAGDVAASPMYFSASPSSPLLARGAAVYDDGSTTTCAHDLALIGLDRSINGITPAQLRSTTVAVGDDLVAMGFGWTDRAAMINATERMKGTTSVLALGATVTSFKPFGDASAMSEPLAIANGEVAVNGLTMTGDSGGPAFDASGRLAALVSRGYNDALYGPGTFTSIAAHLATIDAALVATGNPKLGAGAGGDAGGGGGGGMPTPDGGSNSVTPTPPARDPQDGSTDASSSGASGCAVEAAAARGGAGHRTWILAAFSALGLVLARRRRRG
jgi:hypothetical protein